MVRPDHRMALSHTVRRPLKYFKIVTLQLPSNRKSDTGFQLLYLDLTLTLSKGQSKVYVIDVEMRMDIVCRIFSELSITL